MSGNRVHVKDLLQSYSSWGSHPSLRPGTEPAGPSGGFWVTTAEKPLTKDSTFKVSLLNRGTDKNNES